MKYSRTTPRRYATRNRGFGGTTSADDATKSRISAQWKVLKVTGEDRDATPAGVKAVATTIIDSLSKYAPWGGSGPHAWTSVENGGWYDYEEIRSGAQAFLNKKWSADALSNEAVNLEQRLSVPYQNKANAIQLAIAGNDFNKAKVLAAELTGSLLTPAIKASLQTPEDFWTPLWDSLKHYQGILGNQAASEQQAAKLRENTERVAAARQEAATTGSGGRVNYYGTDSNRSGEATRALSQANQRVLQKKKDFSARLDQLVATAPNLTIKDIVSKATGLRNEIKSLVSTTQSWSKDTDWYSSDDLISKSQAIIDNPEAYQGSCETLAKSKWPAAAKAAVLVPGMLPMLAAYACLQGCTASPVAPQCPLPSYWKWVAGGVGTLLLLAVVSVAINMGKNMVHTATFGVLRNGKKKKKKK